MSALAATVLRYAHYLGSDGQSVYSYEEFCGSCRQHLPSAHAFPKEPEALDSEEGFYGRIGTDRKLAYIAYCPWCGVAFEDEWWRNQPIQNERIIDHYRNPGTHKGDVHEFPCDPANHWLAVSGGDTVCWCDPLIEPGLMSCTIRHQDKNYEDYLSTQRALAQAADEEYDW